MGAVVISRSVNMFYHALVNKQWWMCVMDMQNYIPLMIHRDFAHIDILILALAVQLAVHVIALNWLVRLEMLVSEVLFF